MSSYYAKLSKTLKKYNLTIKQHREDITWLFAHDDAFRSWIMNNRPYDKEFTWYNNKITIQNQLNENPITSAMVEGLLRSDTPEAELMKKWTNNDIHADDNDDSNYNDSKCEF